MIPRKKPLKKKRSTPRKWTCTVCKAKTTGKTCSECHARRTVKRSNLKAKCDRLARELCMRLANGKCAKCGGVGTDWAHRMPRRHHSMRWDMTNCDLLCRPCHVYFTRNPFAFTQWLIRKMGSNELAELEQKANAQWDRDYLKVIRYLEQYESTASRSETGEAELSA